MKRIGWTMMLLGAALWIAGCNGAEQKPPAGPPAVDTEAPTPDDQPAEMPPGDARATAPADQPAETRPDEAPALMPPEQPAKTPPGDTQATGPDANAGTTAGEKEKGKVPKAVGRALLKAVTGKSEKEERDEAPAFKP